MPVTERDNKYILVITDVFTKWVEASPLQNTTAETMAACLVNEVVCRYGAAAVIHSDQGANLCGDVARSMCHLLGIQQTRTSAYHPQGNGQVERFNRSVQAILAKVVKDDQKDWDLHLPQALFAYRTSVQESTGFTLFWCDVTYAEWCIITRESSPWQTEYKKVMKSLKITDETVTWLDCMNMYISL